MVALVAEMVKVVHSHILSCYVCGVYPLANFVVVALEIHTDCSYA
jgi:hypothetical protein